MRDYAAVNIARADAIASARETEQSILEQRWETDWFALVDPKKVLAALSLRLGVFKSPDAFVSALVARASQDETVRPNDLEIVRQLMAEHLH